MKRLNGWQRIGVILSAIWLIGGTLLARSVAVTNADQVASTAAKMCRDRNNSGWSKVFGEGECNTVAGKDLRQMNAADFDLMKRCMDKATTQFPPTACDDSYRANFERSLQGSWWGAFLLAGIVPIPIGWLLVYGLVGMVRWVRRGFAV